MKKPQQCPYQIELPFYKRPYYVTKKTKKEPTDTKRQFGYEFGYVGFRLFAR
jgi:hypothetical protein